MIKYLFFDRDGTLGSLSDIRKPWTFKPFFDIKSLFCKLKNMGLKVFIVTNQACIARKSDAGYSFENEFSGYGADDFFICPHDDKDNCNCRKPKTGLLMQAKDKYNIDFKESLIIGDRQSDIKCGSDAGAYTVYFSPDGESQHGDIAADYKIGDINQLFDIIKEINNSQIYP